MAETNQEHLGIENIEAVLTFAIGLGLKTAKYLKDGKISVPEGVGLAMEIPAALKSAKQIKDAVKEIKDLDPDELKKIMSTVIELLDVEVEGDDEQ
jgi:hypothetical protein